MTPPLTPQQVSVSSATPLFALPNPCRHPLRQRFFRSIAPPLEEALALRSCQRLYDEIAASDSSSPFAEQLLARLDIRISLPDDSLARIPEKGPVVVIANHPFGCVEGLVLAAALRHRRPDLKIMANHLLSRIPEMRDELIAVDPFGGQGAARRNVAGLRASIAWLNQGGLLVIFPAGSVAHLHLKTGKVMEPAWQANLARIIRQSGATVTPVYFTRANGPLFQLAGFVHPKLRTALLARELFNQQGREIRLVIGNPIAAAKLREMASDERVMDYLRLRTLFLRHSAAFNAHKAAKPLGSRRKAPEIIPIVAALDPSALDDEIGRLPRESMLMKSGALTVFVAAAHQIPVTLAEIGRLREITFRAAAEGTGRATDIDQFDQHYLHLFLWNPDRREVAGAYRMGLVDRILPSHGVDGLYASTLFRLRSELFDRLGPCLEMGRSFVRLEYQKKFGPLLLLWKGIGQFLVRTPRYRTLFGPVSINRNYGDLSRQLIISSLREQCRLPELERLVRSRTPLKMRPLSVQGCEAEMVRTTLADMDEVEALMAELEAEEKEIPVLLKFYLQLGGRVLAFNLDLEFSDVLDGLIVVDRLQTKRKALERYLGKEGAAHFLAWHGVGGGGP